MIYDDGLKNNFPVFIVYNRLTVNLPFVRNAHQYYDPVSGCSSSSPEPIVFFKGFNPKQAKGEGGEKSRRGLFRHSPCLVG